jgi:hypothetical protein
MRPTQPLDQSREKRNDESQHAQKTSDHRQPAHDEQGKRASIDSARIEPSAYERQWRTLQQGVWERQVRIAKWLNWITAIAAGVGLGGLAILYLSLKSTDKTVGAAIRQADAAATQAYIAQQQLMLSERPWIKIRHRIAKPLTFDHPAWKGKVATVTIENTIENVGQSVALDVLIWEDVFPQDAFGIRTARARRDEVCNAERHSTGGLSGYILFPHDPLTENSVVGPSMEVVMKAVSASPQGLRGKAAFVLVGCVSYRVPFESRDDPRHETRFIYMLGRSLGWGGVQPFVEPRGVHPEIQLIAFPDGFSAD